MFTPGTIISEFTSKKGKKIVFRLPVLDDVPLLTQYVNTISDEDTFVTLSGEHYTEEEEQKVVEEWIMKMSKNDKVVLVGFDGPTLVAIADIDRLARRSKHVGHLGISIAKDYRDEGIGTKLMETLVELARKMGLQMIELVAYLPNTQAIHVYTKVGFKEVGRIPKKALFHGELIDEVIMLKSL